MMKRLALALAYGFVFGSVGIACLAQETPGAPSDAIRVFRAGACSVDVSPTRLPVIVNGNFFAVTADRVVDPLHARALVLSDGKTTIALCVVDSCLIPREMADRIKALVHKTADIAPDHIMISATHTHSAPSLMQAHGTDVDPHYPQFLVVQVVDAMVRAARNMVPAEIGHTVVDDDHHTHCRQWIFRPDRVGTDPFGEKTVRANMHPGHQNPDCIGPEGPVDPAMTLLSVRTVEGRPIALLANYAMHYFGAPAVSADYFGHFAAKIERLLAAAGDGPPIVGIMSQGTSGDAMWPDYGQPAAKPTIEAYADEVAAVAYKAYRGISHERWVPLAMREQNLKLAMRVPDDKRLEWSRQLVTELNGRPPRTLPELYAREQLYLREHPKREVKLQAIRIGELGIVAIPCEVFGITGLKIKAQSPLNLTMNIELANGEDGYIPPPELHKLGGYTTWACRTAGLETTAEPEIVAAVVNLLEEVSGRPRRKVVDVHGQYAQTVLRAKPVAYWRMNEWSGPSALDASGHHAAATYEDGIAFYLDGPRSSMFSGPQNVNRAPHFAGGRLRASVERLGRSYSVEMWFWNGLPGTARAVTGYLFSRSELNPPSAAGDQLAIGGMESASGKLLFSDGNKTFAGQSPIAERAWNHVVLVRDVKQLTVYLNGNPRAEISDTVEAELPATASQLFIGGRSDGVANFEGKLDEVAVYDRALSTQEVVEHFQAAALAKPDSSLPIAPRP